MKNSVALVGLVLVGCGHTQSDRVCIAHVRGVCSAYEVHPTEREQRQEDLDRRFAAARGESSVPPWRAGESASEHLTRMTEESNRQAAASRGEPYFPPQRSGESSLSWMKRVSGSQSNDASSNGMPSFGTGSSGTPSGSSMFSSGSSRR